MIKSVAPCTDDERLNVNSQTLNHAIYKKLHADYANVYSNISGTISTDMFVFHAASASSSARRQPLHDHVAQSSSENAIFVGGPVLGNSSGVYYMGKHYCLNQTLHA